MPPTPEDWELKIREDWISYRVGESERVAPTHYLTLRGKVPSAELERAFDSLRKAHGADTQLSAIP